MKKKHSQREINFSAAVPPPRLSTVIVGMSRTHIKKVRSSIHISTPLPETRETLHSPPSLDFYDTRAPLCSCNFKLFMVRFVSAANCSPAKCVDCSCWMRVPSSTMRLTATPRPRVRPTPHTTPAHTTLYEFITEISTN